MCMCIAHIVYYIVLQNKNTIYYISVKNIKVWKYKTKYDIYFKHIWVIQRICMRFIGFKLNIDNIMLIMCYII